MKQWETETREESEGCPEGPGWEPFSSFAGQSYGGWVVYISWRRKVATPGEQEEAT